MTPEQRKKIDADFDAAYEQYRKEHAADIEQTQMIDEDDDIQIYKDDGNARLIAYQSGYYDGKKAALAGREWNFCERCGKRTKDIHTCTPPQENT